MLTFIYHSISYRKYCMMKLIIRHFFISAIFLRDLNYFFFFVVPCTGFLCSLFAVIEGINQLLLPLQRILRIFQRKSKIAFELLLYSCEEAEALAKKLKLRFYRASVKEDLNVTEVFKYLADKYLQRLKQQTAEDPELVHTSSNKIGIFNTAGGSHSNQNSSTLNGGDVINLRPNKQRTKKNRSLFSNCSIP
ncbi:ras-related protein Rab-23 isoform X2 [Nyctibius grandis]|uniref:ras-related protein Rab-23 isoform X2 n=1 Tax=Nyctibius grandis TaxID=48427 RepID=UPI0035BBD111